MSRFDFLNLAAQAVYARIRPHSSLRPIRHAAIVSALSAFELAEIHTALQQLTDARLITSMRHTIDGKTQDVYWPTGLKPITAPSLEEISMASEPKNSQLARMILQHGPISGADLAAKATAAGLNCPTKNIQGILAGHLARNEIVMKKRDGLNWYMTPNQADEWDENVAAAGGDRDNQSGAHVMSAPPVSAKQSEAETTENETDEAMPEPDAALLAMANGAFMDKIETLEQNATKMRTLLATKTETIVLHEKTIHELRNDVSAANLIFQQLCTELNLENPEEIPAAIDELMRAVCNSDNRIAQQPGRLALLLIDSAELTELEELDANCDPRIAQAAAMARIDQGHAARAVVVRIIGEAVRQAEWKEAA